MGGFGNREEFQRPMCGILVLPTVLQVSCLGLPQTITVPSWPSKFSPSVDRRRAYPSSREGPRLSGAITRFDNHANPRLQVRVPERTARLVRVFLGYLPWVFVEGKGRISDRRIRSLPLGRYPQTSNPDKSRCTAPEEHLGLRYSWDKSFRSSTNFGVILIPMRITAFFLLCLSLQGKELSWPNWLAPISGSLIRLPSGSSQGEGLRFGLVGQGRTRMAACL